MKFEDLQKRFQVSKLKHNGKYLVFDKDTSKGSRMVHKYLCQVGRKGYYFFVEGFKPTRDIDVLEKQVRDYVKALPYDSEYYMPLYREGIFEEHIIHDYLVERGFKNEGDYSYTLNDKNIYGFKSSDVSITLSGLDPWAFGLNSSPSGKTILPKEVKIILWTGRYSWVEVVTKREVEDIKKGLDSMLKPLYITDSVDNMQRAEKLNNVGDVEMTLNVITQSYDHGTMEFKEVLKKQLQETLAKLG